MLEKVDLNKSVDKENYKKLREEMDVKLGELQRACKAEKIPVVIVFDGFGAGGKGTQINRLIQPDSGHIYLNGEDETEVLQYIV